MIKSFATFTWESKKDPNRKKNILKIIELGIQDLNACDTEVSYPDFTRFVTNNGVIQSYKNFAIIVGSSNVVEEVWIRDKKLGEIVLNLKQLTKAQQLDIIKSISLLNSSIHENMSTLSRNNCLFICDDHNDIVSYKKYRMWGD